MSYATRAFASRDPRFGRIFQRLGHKAPLNPVEVLRAEAEDIGVHVDGRWGEERLREEIAAAKKPKQKAPETPPEKPAAKAKAEDGDRYERRDMRAKDA